MLPSPLPIFGLSLVNFFVLNNRVTIAIRNETRVGLRARSQRQVQPSLEEGKVKGDA
jgi:hypothetical protein